MDKFYSFFIAQRELKIKDCALLVCAGDNDASSFDGIVSSYRLIASLMNWNDVGTILVPGLHGKDDILKTDGLKRAEALGKSIL